MKQSSGVPFFSTLILFWLTIGANITAASDLAALTKLALAGGADAVSAQSFAHAVDVAMNKKAKLTPSDGAVSDYFGYSVSLSGDRALVGAFQHDANGSNSGAAYVFVFDGVNWNEEARLVPSDSEAFDAFGYSVALLGDRALVGAYFDSDNGALSGSAYVFTFNGTGWVEQAKLIPADPVLDGYFGCSVSLSGNRALIGSWGANDFSGAAYMFTFDGTTWAQEAKLSPTHGANNFGISVSLSNNRALIGSFEKAAFVFSFNGTSWNQEAKLSAGDSNDLGGIHVSLSGHRALVSAVGDSDHGLGSGAAYIFVFDGAAWTQEAKLSASDEMAGDSFGSSVSLSGKRALIGAIQNDSDGPGAAYLFAFDGTAWVQQAKLIASDGATGDYFGTSVSLSGRRALVGASVAGIINGWPGAAYCLWTLNWDSADFDALIFNCLPLHQVFANRWRMGRDFIPLPASA